jgi:predicted methyltransferase
VVGASGRVIAQNSRISNERHGAALRERIESSGLENVELLVADLDAVPLPGGLDAVFLVQFYHDTVWMGFDRAEMNRRVFEALKPGGRFVVIDHSAEIGSGERDAERLHRVDESLVRREVLAAGFTLKTESPALRNERDDREGDVFGWWIRGRSDRFLLVFEKPAPPGAVRVGQAFTP